MESKKFNVNSVMLLLLSVVMGVCGWSLNQNVSTVKDDIRQMKTDLAPRHEVELELKAQAIEVEAIKGMAQRNAEGILELRTRMTKMEVDIAGMGRK